LDSTSSLPGTVNRRIKALIAAHAILGPIPALNGMFGPNTYLLPLLWTAASVGVGSLLTLSFWVGFGRNRIAVRAAIAVAVCAYVAIWPTVSVIWGHDRPPSAIDMIWQFLSMTLTYSIVVVVLGLCFLPIRRWLTLRRMPRPVNYPARGQYQYSVRNLFIVMTITAAILAFIQLSRSNNGQSTITATYVAETALGFGIFLLNTVLAALAALGTARPGPRIAAVLFIAALLGLALSLAGRHDQIGWWLVPFGTVITIIPTTIVIASLLVIRSCDFRLVPNQ
jgi:hypothetical protein